MEPLEFPVYPEDTGWVRGCCSLVLPPLLGRQAWRPVELSRVPPGALPDRAGERQLSLSAPFIAVTTTVHEAVNPSSPSSRVHEGRDPGCLFTAMSLPCIQWCLSHSNRSINICPINGRINEWINGGVKTNPRGSGLEGAAPSAAWPMASRILQPYPLLLTLFSGSKKILV